MREFKKWYFRIYLFFVRILIVSMIIGISFPVHVFGTTELKQLYALSAVLMDADSGRDYGAVTDVLKTGANDVYEITGDDGKAYLLPAIPMTVIEIRLEEGLMRIRPIEGIFDHED